MEPEYLKNYWPVGSVERRAYMWGVEYSNMLEGMAAWGRGQYRHVPRVSIINTTMQFYGDAKLLRDK